MQGNDGYRLVVRRGPQPNQVYELKDEVINLGRDITNNIVINDREASRHHLRLMRGVEGYTIEDLGSTNGTFVNGRRITGATPLKPGDMIGLGETVTLGYEAIRPGAPAGAPPPAAPAPEDRPAPYAPPQQGGMPSPQPSPYQPPAGQPYQPPAGQPYQPPAGQPYQPPAGQPYQPPAQQSPYQPPAGQPYQPPQGGQYQPDPYAPADPYAQGQDYYQQQPGYGPPPPGYDYDPYAMREEGGNNTMRLILYGCLGLLVFCCCITVAGVVLVDTLNLYCDLPILRDILQAIGLLRC